MKHIKKLSVKKAEHCVDIQSILGDPLGCLKEILGLPEKNGEQA